MRDCTRRFEGSVNIESGANHARIAVMIPEPLLAQKTTSQIEEPQAAI